MDWNWKKNERNTRERKKTGEWKKKNDTLNKKMVVSRFLCREFFLIERSLGRFLHIFRSILFPKTSLWEFNNRRARNRQHAFIIIIYTTIERERERRPVSIYKVSRLRLLFARSIYCGVVRASKIISLRIREKKEKWYYRFFAAGFDMLKNI